MRRVLSRREEDQKKKEAAEVGRITVKERVHMPGENVPLLKDVTCDMARGDVNTVGQDTMFQASGCESNKMTATWRTNCDKRLGQER